MHAVTLTCYFLANVLFIETNIQFMKIYCGHKNAVRSFKNDYLCLRRQKNVSLK